MELFKVSNLTGQPHTMRLPLSEKEYAELHKDWKENRKMIQEVFHMLNPEQREFIMTGITPEEWEELYGV